MEAKISDRLHRPSPPGSTQPQPASRADCLSYLLAAIVAAAAFLWTWWHDPRRPASALPSDGWWSNYDQHHYLLSALAFSHGDLSPDAHWYLPAYAALASVFVHLLPADPFMIPDLGCLLASLWLSGSIGAALSPDWRPARLAGLASFMVCTVLLPVSLTPKKEIVGIMLA